LSNLAIYFAIIYVKTEPPSRHRRSFNPANTFLVQVANLNQQIIWNTDIAE